MRLLVIPRWGGTPADDFYPWLVAALGTRADDPFEEIEVAGMPAPSSPTIEAWSAAVLERLGDPARAAETVVVGHSVGFQAVMRALAAMPDGARVRGALGVAAWWHVDRPWPAIVPWTTEPFDVARTRAAALRVDVLLSTDDPFTADSRETKRLFEERLGARVDVVEGGGHFNGRHEPRVLDAILRTASV